MFSLYILTLCSHFQAIEKRVLERTFTIHKLQVSFLGDFERKVVNHAGFDDIKKNLLDKGGECESCKL